MARKKPEKPNRNFPLFAHQNGQWAKKVKGRLRYFGRWEDPEAALDKYLEQKDELQAGREPADPGLRLWELGEFFLGAKRQLVDSGELSPRTWQSYKATVDTLLKHLGRETPVESLSPGDFESLRGKLAKVRKAVALGNEIQRVRTIFKYGFDAGHLTTPVRFGTHFKRPARRVIRAAKHAAGLRMFDADEIVTLYSTADPILRAMILLGINCGFGNSDIASLPLSAIKGNWIEFPRPKTAVPRRCPLWPETAQALNDVIARRRSPRRPENSHLVFLTRLGQPWVRVSKEKSHPIDEVGKRFTHLMNSLQKKWLIRRRPGVNFYALRHVFETIGQEAKDPLAVAWIMGHAPQDMGGHYRETVSDERLLAVTEVVRQWLFPVPTAG